MSTGGKLGSVDILAGVNTLLYAVSGRIPFYATISVVNRNDKDVKIRIAIVDGLTVADLTDDDYIEYDVTLRPNGVLERTNISININHCVVVYSDSSNVSFGMWA